MALEATKSNALAEEARRGNLHALGELLREMISTFDALSDAEIAFLDGIVAGTGAASKALVLDANGGATVPGELALDGNTLATEAGVGITGGTGTVYKSSVVKVGGIITTRILIDLTGLNSGGADLDVIGTNGAGVAHLGRITAARNGTILGGYMRCLEVPAGGADDIDFYSADEATGVEDTLITDLTNDTALITAGSAWALNETAALGAVPAANQYLYLTNGEAVGGTYTAGKFLIELYGYDA